MSQSSQAVLTAGLSLQPDIGIGYGRVSDANFNISGDFLMTKVYLDGVWFLVPSGLAVFSEVVLVGAPLGRSADRQNVSADFRPLLRLGVSI